jgi:hypothetical protein
MSDEDIFMYDEDEIDIEWLDDMASTGEGVSEEDRKEYLRIFGE